MCDEICPLFFCSIFPFSGTYSIHTEWMLWWQKLFRITCNEGPTLTWVDSNKMNKMGAPDLAAIAVKHTYTHTAFTSSDSSISTCHLGAICTSSMIGKTFTHILTYAPSYQHANATSLHIKYANLCALRLYWGYNPFSFDVILLKYTALIPKFSTNIQVYLHFYPHNNCF